MEHSQWMRHHFVGTVAISIVWSKFTAADVVVMSPQGKPRISLRSTTAQFGPALPDSGLIGYVVRSQPATACTPLSLLDVFRDVLEWWKPKILLIQQSDECAFEDQVYRAQVSGYKAAVIFNAFSDDLLVMPRRTTLNITIPAFFVGHADGVLLWEKYYSATEYYALLSPDQPKMGTALELSLILLPACIVIIPFLVAFILTMVSGRCPLTLMAFRHVHLKTRLIFQLPERKWDADADPGREISPCSICLEDFQKGEKVRTIPPCGHEFHSRCVDPWLLRDHLVCPLCRSEVNLDLTKLPRTSQTQSDAAQGNPGVRQRIFTILPRWLPVRPRSTVPTAAVQASVV